MKLINEVLQGVRVVKLYAWEQSMKAKIDAVRKEELKLIRKQRIISSCFVVLLLSLSTFVTVVTFSTYALAGNSLRAGTIVTAHLLLTMLRFPLAFGPVLLIQLGNFMVREAFSARERLIVQPAREPWHCSKESLKRAYTTPLICMHRCR